MSKKLYLTSIAVLWVLSVNSFVWALDLSQYTNLWESLTSSLLSWDVEESTDDVTNSWWKIESFEVIKETYKVTNESLEVEWNLYVYWDLLITNWDLINKGKIKVTWNLKVVNWDIDNAWRLYVKWKITVVNWKRDWRPVKLDANVIRFDPILKAELMDDSVKEVYDIILAHYKDMASLRNEIKTAYKNSQPIDELVKKVETLRDSFFSEIESYIQADDMEAFEALKQKEITELGKFIDWNNRFRSVLSQAMRALILSKVWLVKVEKRRAFLEKVIARVEAMVAKWNINEKKKSLLIAMKEVFQSELDKLVDDTIDEVMNDESSSSSQVSSSSSSVSSEVASSSSSSSSSSAESSSSSSSSSVASSSSSSSEASSSSVSSQSSSSSS